MRFGIPIGEKQSIHFGAGVDYTAVEIDRNDPNTPIQYKEFSDKFCNGSQSCGNTSVPLTIGWINDSKDSAILPTRGGIQRINYEVSPGGSIRYHRISYQQQHFFSIIGSWVLMLNGEFGYARGISGQALPYYKNFYAGGPNSVRGYELSSLGPYWMSPNGDAVRLGGVRRVIMNAELSMPVPGFGVDKSVRFGPFFDAGQVYGDKNNKTPGMGSEGPMRMSVGLAATWVSPFGPMKFSIAYPLNEQEHDRIQRFQFQMGQAF